MKKGITLIAILFITISLIAQEKRVSWSAGLISEGQWNLSEGKTGWANLVNADIAIALWKGALFDAAALSTYSAGTPVANDRQGFSNIDAENRGFRLFHAGLSQTFLQESLTAFIGLKAADEDFFNTDLAGVFTGSSYGGIPTCTENHAIAVYPEAALAAHVEYHKGNWTVRETLYNGRPSDRMDEQFRFRPKRDGLFNIGSVMYSEDDEEFAATSYTLGYAYTTKEASGQDEGSIWGCIEQPVTNIGEARLSLLAQGSTHLTDDAPCNGFWAGGFVVENMTKHGGQLGLAVNRIYYNDGNETDIELTFHCPIGAGFSIQPALHAIRTDGESTLVGQLRLCYEIGGR